VGADRLRGYGLALVAASLWATLGLFYTRLEAYGLPRLTIVFYRAAVAAVVLFLVLGWRQRVGLRLERRDWFFFLFFGLIGVAAFYVVYIHAIALIGMGMAAVLMYTAPAWVTLLSVVLFKERLGGLKSVAVLLACGGCALIWRACASTY
jgi:DME family drug/metabolite transporter